MASKFLRVFLMVLLAAVLLGVAWVWFTLQWSYSKGERAGYVQKLSEKGWVCKTWEGEIAMVTMPGAIPDKFEFTVRDDFVAQKINQLAGKRVVLIYRQHKFIPSSCFGETEYFVDDVREVGDVPAVPALSAPASQPLPAGQLTPAR
jgi:hypothetical protein